MNDKPKYRIEVVPVLDQWQASIGVYIMRGRTPLDAVRKLMDYLEACNASGFTQ